MLVTNIGNPTDFHSFLFLFWVVFYSMEVNGDQQLLGYKIAFLCLAEERKIRVCNNFRVSKW